MNGLLLCLSFATRTNVTKRIEFSTWGEGRSSLRLSHLRGNRGLLVLYVESPIVLPSLRPLVRCLDLLGVRTFIGLYYFLPRFILVVSFGRGQYTCFVGDFVRFGKNKVWVEVFL